MTLTAGLVAMGTNATIGGTLNVSSNTTVGGDLDMSSNKITNLGTPENSNDAATKDYVDNNAGKITLHDNT